MLDETTRSAALRLHAEGHGARAISKALGISRGAVKRVLREGRAAVPELERAEKAKPYRDQILELYASCKGNLVRVHEELLSAGAALSYQALTALFRPPGIGITPPPPTGRPALLSRPAYPNATPSPPGLSRRGGTTVATTSHTPGF